ncbi:TFIIH complex subunit TFB5 Ecym_5535 [Eremothecium cymbalariae DBVPG|uniref:General transcription and DNA repair factor IIH subunit TFB5 n=1 Tax=Eremothecium cymbalariae (strain CBS 270.75 / DBVPG 7215 / KCTC 17166 / NRRL Y-17582) TaxID=931890 RepID=I6NDY3_ERECY|nr:hypothetical protein Ecym_5535 [Eremothecium cymbalariae DBVPG\
MPRARKGALVQCDPSIKALILQIDSGNHDIIWEELDDTHLLVDPEKVAYVKEKLNWFLSKNIYNPLEDEDTQ